MQKKTSLLVVIALFGTLPPSVTLGPSFTGCSLMRGRRKARRVMGQF
jgi:hypothetical protein